MNRDIRKRIIPGARVRIIQQIAARAFSWPSVTEGVVVSYQQKPTGSWYAHSKNDKLWLDRVVIRKADGEVSTLNLDDYSNVEVEESP